MPLIIPPGYADIAIEIRMTGDPDPWYVTFGVDSSEHAGDPLSIGTVANDAWAHPMTMLSTDATHTGCKVTVGQDGAEPLRSFISVGASTPGGAGSGMLPQNCAALVHKETNVGGRRAKGRFFVPAILVEGSVDNVGVIAGAHFNALQTAFTAMMNELLNSTPGPTTMVVLHNDGGITPIIDPTVVTALRVDGVVSTQRRRLR